MKRSEGPIILHYELPAEKSTLWSTLVTWEEMVQWFFSNIPAFRAEVGFSTSFPVHNEGRTFTHLWQIDSVVEEQHITYKWRYEEYPGNALLTFRLEPLDLQTTRLEVTMEILEDFPDEIPEFQRSSCIGGWDYFIGEQLRAYLAKR